MAAASVAGFDELEALQQRRRQHRRRGGGEHGGACLLDQPLDDVRVAGDEGAGNADTLAVAEALLARGIWAPAIRPPTVPKGEARLRISLTAAHSEAQVDALLAALGEIAA